LTGADKGLKKAECPTVAYLDLSDYNCCNKVIVQEQQTMNHINRAAIIIKPKHPFLGWVNSEPGQEPLSLEQITEENTTFLIPEIDTLDQGRRSVKQYYNEIFAYSLFGWNTDQKTWPKDRTYKMFTEWFNVEINSEVIDLVEDEIEKEKD
jgi:hypothetical protein